jgi:hypothetical protein
MVSVTLFIPVCAFRIELIFFSEFLIIQKRMARHFRTGCLYGCRDVRLFDGSLAPPFKA